MSLHAYELNINRFDFLSYVDMISYGVKLPDCWLFAIDSFFCLHIDVAVSGLVLSMNLLVPPSFYTAADLEYTMSYRDVVQQGSTYTHKHFGFSWEK